MPVASYCIIAYLAGFVSALLVVFSVGRRETRREAKAKDERIVRRVLLEQQTQAQNPGLWLPRSAVEAKRNGRYNMGEEDDAKS
jgi:hypothetical protein